MNSSDKISYTVEVYKKDARTKAGERLCQKTDHIGVDLNTIKHLYETTWLANDGYRIEIHDTYVTRINIVSGAPFQERYDTPRYCSPSSESFWSN